MGVHRDELTKAIARLTLAPGWSITTYEHPFEGPYVCFRGAVPDSYHDCETVLCARSPVPVPALRSQDAILDWLLWRWLIIWSHEAREYFRVDGVAWKDPHAEGPDGPGT